MSKMILRGDEVTLAELKVNVVLLPATYAITVSAMDDEGDPVFAHTHLVERKPGAELPPLSSLTMEAFRAFKVAFADEGGVIVEATA